MKIRSYLDKEF